MANKLQTIFEQKVIPGGELTDLFTVPAGRQVQMPMFTARNTGGDTQCSIAVVPEGEEVAEKHYILTEYPIPGGATRPVAIPMSPLVGPVTVKGIVGDDGVNIHVSLVSLSTAIPRTPRR